MKEKVGQVTPKERTEIQLLFERNMGETGTKFQNWWDRMSGQYQWKSTPNGHWEINFDTCEIFLSEE